ncbi:MAG: hypothetical protein HRT90_00150 [Candidatus Margulisbacteria bacterium]|nr:hypothetical protein [Candidatus Margulisiibacteriota bacterium]
MKSCLLPLLDRYSKDGLPIKDSDQKTRSEIPAAFLLGMIALDDQSNIQQQLMEMVLSLQTPEGYWPEKSYASEDEDVGYFGAVPTAFSVIALAAYYHLHPKERVLKALLWGADYLIQHEQNGRFLKSSVNKSDVLNTNMLSGVALLAASEYFPEDSQRKIAYKNASQRAILKTIRAQLISGAFPYTDMGLQVPYLYHAMTLGLLSYVYPRFSHSSLLQQSTKRGLRFYNHIIDPDGKVKWRKEKFTDKSGASWFYGWSLITAKTFLDQEHIQRLEGIIEDLKVPDGYLSNDNADESDLFYTAWTVFAASLSVSVQPQKCPFLSISSYYPGMALKYIQRLGYVIKYGVNKASKSVNGINRGPIEHW